MFPVRWLSRAVCGAALLATVLLADQTSATPSDVAAASPVPTAGVQQVQRQVFRAGGGDLYAFRDESVVRRGTAGVPWILYIHGGSWAYGGPGQASAVEFCRHQARLGFACFSADYPLSGARIWPAQRDMVAAQLAWVRRHASTLGLDPSAGFLVGHSAGGLMAGLVGLHDGRLAGIAIFDGATDVALTMTGSSLPSLRAHASALVGGAPSDAPLTRSASVLSGVHRDTPRVPFLVIQDLRDPVVHAIESTELVRGLSAAGFPVTYDLLPYRTHSTEVDPTAVAAADAWFAGRLATLDRS